jgi:hypothetical protein
MQSLYELGLTEDDIAEGAPLGLTLPEMSVAKRMGVSFAGYARHKRQPPSAEYLRDKQRSMLTKMALAAGGMAAQRALERLEEDNT